MAAETRSPVNAAPSLALMTISKLPDPLAAGRHRHRAARERLDADLVEGHEMLERGTAITLRARSRIRPEALDDGRGREDMGADGELKLLVELPLLHLDGKFLGDGRDSGLNNRAGSVAAIV